MASIFDSSSFLQLEAHTTATSGLLSFVETAESTGTDDEELTGIQKKEVDKLKTMFGQIPDF